jgi:Tol biopolymer transport system component
VVFSDGGGVQQLNIDSTDAPTTLPVTWPTSLGGPDAQLAVSSPAVNRSHTQIAFVVGKPQNPGVGAIAVANLDGSSPRALTDGPGDGAPAWSWDGRQIAFNRGGTIWTMNADGTGQRSLGVEGTANWSPDGRGLAIKNVGEPVRIGLLTIATGQVQWLTPADGSVEQFSPAWSPDGTHIVYGQRFAYASQPAGLFVANADGSDARRLTSCSEPCEDDGEPSWSSDATAIAFVRYLTTAPSTPQVYVVAASGGAARQLTSGPHPHDTPSW